MANSGAGRTPVRLLLISPRVPESFWSFRWALRNILPDKRAINPPLGLATVAALCPPGWEVDILDENVESLPLKPRADIVGIGGMGVQFFRQRELLDFYRRQGYFTVAGGSYASLCPERYEGLADTVVSGEAERIWPRFCRDFEIGAPQHLYRETGVIDLETSPVPRYDLLKLARYRTAAMQFSRGCPYRCDFCDIVVMFGRRPRTKRLDQIGAELDVLRSLEIRNVFFVDDNLIGDRKAAKQLLQFVTCYQRTHGYNFRFGTEASLNLAQDKELMQLFHCANFTWVFIGIESPDEESLKESHKTQNTRQDILAAVRAIYSHGIDVLAGFIVGFDNDTVDIFERQQRFISLSGIVVSMVGLLTALPRTPLYKRLEEAGRLLPGREHGDNTGLGTNFLPKLMAYDEMIAGYKRLCRGLFTDRGIGQRIRNKARYLRRPRYPKGLPVREGAMILGRLLVKGLLPGGFRRVYHFLRTLAVSPRAWPQIIEDWVAGLAVLNYVERNFSIDPRRDRKLLQITVALIGKLCAPGIRRGALELAARMEANEVNLLVLLRGRVEGVFYTRAARSLEALLRRSAATLTLCVDELCREQHDSLDRLLKRLAPWGDRVSVWLSDQVRLSVPVDSSVFHLLLGARPEPLPQAQPLTWEAADPG